jgi:hypothetical protein
LKTQLVEALQLNIHQFRYIVLPISFNYFHWLKTQQIEPSPNYLCVQYTGTEKAIATHQMAAEIHSV